MAPCEVPRVTVVVAEQSQGAGPQIPREAEPGSCQSPGPAQARRLHRTHCSCHTYPFRQSGKTFQKGGFPPPPPSCAKTLSFHGDSQIANPSKSGGVGEGEAGLSPEKWARLVLVFILSSRQPFQGMMGKSRGCQVPQQGVQGLSLRRRGRPSVLPHGKAQVNPFGDASWGSSRGCLPPGAFPSPV